MKYSEFKKLFLFRRKGTANYYDRCFYTPEGVLYVYSGSSDNKKDKDGCWDRIFISEDGTKKTLTLTWQQFLKIEQSPLLTGQDAYNKLKSSVR